jgi:hypothetical protein
MSFKDDARRACLNERGPKGIIIYIANILLMGGIIAIFILGGILYAPKASDETQVDSKRGILSPSVSWP